MKTKYFGYLLIIAGVVLAIGTFFLENTVTENINQEIEIHDKEGIPCGTVTACPHKQLNKVLPYFYASYSIAGLIIIVGIWLALTESSSEKMAKELEEKEKKREISSAIMSALDEDEQKVINAVKEQDGITQNTLRLRTDMSKAKLSVILSQLEKKNLIKKVPKGKTNQIFLKRSI
ncbi:MAG: hypothetical protein QW331_00835 [Candidatus Woesearchaeota archaeon]